MDSDRQHDTSHVLITRRRLLPSGKVLVAGGVNAAYLSSAELYDPATGTWTVTGGMATGRSSHTATLIVLRQGAGGRGNR